MERSPLLVALLMSLPLSLSAQEPPPPTQQPPPTVQEPPAEPVATPAARQERREQPRRWAGALDLGFTSSTGNTELTALTTGVRLRHLQTRVFKLEWSANFRYGESGGEVVARHVQSKLDFDMGPSARYAPYIAASAERDPFRRLDLRSRVGSGVRYGFYRGDRGEAALRVGALYSHERFTPVADRLPRSDGTFSFELRGGQGFGEGLRLENTSAWEPVIGDLTDYNVELKSKLTSRISRRLALTLTHQYSYDSTPPANVVHADQRFQAGITVDF
jgi:putative salt-induced outer membrane protein YdiY